VYSFLHIDVHSMGSKLLNWHLTPINQSIKQFNGSKSNQTFFGSILT